MNLHILHICVLSPQCGWSCGSSSLLIDQMTYHILSKCGSSLHYGQACAFSDFQQDQMTCCIGHNCKPFLCCGLPCASSEFLIDQMTSGILNKRESCRHCWWGKDSPSHFACAWTTQRRGDFQTERPETFPCRGYRHFYFSMFRVNFQLSNYF